MRREIEAARLRQHDRMNESIYLAWWVEHIRLSTKVTRSKSRTTKKIVDLKKVLLSEPKTTKQQHVEQMKGALAVLSAQYGIPLRTRRG